MFLAYRLDYFRKFKYRTLRAAHFLKKITKLFRIVHEGSIFEFMCCQDDKKIDAGHRLILIQFFSKRN